MVGGCASATTNDGVGISGVGYNTKLLFTKHYADNQPDNSTSYSSNLYDGIYYAATHGAKIINCSWGSPYASKIAQDIIKYVTLDLGCLVIAAAGNSNVESPLFPAAYDYVLSVASSDESDRRSSFSNYGKSVDIIAPGSDIYTTNYDDAYRTDSGTSLSAPIVAGAAALVWAHNPTFSGLQVGEQLRISADETFYANNSAYVNKLGKGRLDILRALTLKSPSVRASSQLLVNDDGIMPGPGESGKLYFDFTNYLKPSSPALTVTLSSSSPYLTISKTTFILGAMGENTSKKNSDSPFELVFAANLPLSQPIEALLTFSDGSYHDAQLISFVQPSFIDINENNITTSITSAGRIGFGNTQGQSMGSGFIYNDNSLLYEMGLIMGTSSSEVYDNVRGTGGSYNHDFTPSTKIIKMTPGERSYSEITGVFRNAPTEGAESLKISYRSLVWKDDPYKNFVILEYKIKNTTLNPISNFHVGIFADWDIISGGSGDRAAWDNETRLGYVYPARPSTLPRVGIQALNSNAQYYAIDNDPSVAGNPIGIYDGFTDNEKFSTISSGLGKLQAGDGTSGSDVSHVVGVGPYAINAGEEITIAFALHGANSITALINSAKYADSVYNYTFKAPKPIVAVTEACYKSDATVQAAGAEQFHWYKDFVGGAPIHTGSQFKIPTLTDDTVVYVSNADKSYESVRSAASVVVKPNPVISASGPLEFCEGETVKLTTSEGDEYTWSTGEKTQHIETSIGGEYTVAVKNKTLECTDAATVIVYPNPVANFINTLEGIFTNEPITFTNSSEGAVSWNWEFGDGAGSNEENPVHIYTSIGNYTVSLTARSDKGCEATESRAFGIITEAEVAVGNAIDLYPNPVYTKTIKVSRSNASESVEIELFDIKGNLVFSTALPANELQRDFNVSGLSNGTYLVVITSKEKMLSKKIVIAH
jgi:PKD repeat protein